MASNNRLLPRSQSPYTDSSSGVPTWQFYQWCFNIDNAVTALQDAAVVPPSGDFLPITSNVVGLNSIIVYGSLATGIAQVTLSGDVKTPGNTQYYGSGTTGTKGWYNVSDAVTTILLAKTVNSSGITNLDLATLADAGGGTLQKVGRDAYGRISGTSAATTDDLSEGTTNLYYTDARARRVVVLPVVTGDKPPIFVYTEDGSLVYTEIFP